MKWQTQYNQTLFPRDHETIITPGKTIPDQSMSVKELMDRYSKGLPLAGGRTPIWNGEEEMPDIEHMDLADRQTLLETVHEEIKDIRKKANQKAITMKQKREKEQLKAAYKKMREDEENQPKYINPDAKRQKPQKNEENE